MARYTGPKVRISRRLGVNVFENTKGSKALERRPFPPGHHGRSRRKGAGSEYLAQMLEKQKAMLEQQVERADKKSIIFDMMIDLAEKEYNISIRKNSSPEQSTSIEKNTKKA